MSPYDTYTCTCTTLLVNIKVSIGHIFSTSSKIKQRAMPGAAKQWLSADHWKLVRTSNISGYACNSKTKQYIKVISNCQYKTTNFTFFRINEGHNLSSGTIKGTIT